MRRLTVYLHVQNHQPHAAEATVITATQLMRNALGAAHSSEALWAAVGASLRDWRKALVGVLAKGKESGQMAAALNELEVARRLIALAIGQELMEGVLDQPTPYAQRMEGILASLKLELAWAEPS